MSDCVTCDRNIYGDELCPHTELPVYSCAHCAGIAWDSDSGSPDLWER